MAEKKSFAGVLFLILVVVIGVVLFVFWKSSVFVRVEVADATDKHPISKLAAISIEGGNSGPLLSTVKLVGPISVGERKKVQVWPDGLQGKRIEFWAGASKGMPSNDKIVLTIEDETVKVSGQSIAASTGQLWQSFPRR